MIIDARLTRHIDIFRDGYRDGVSIMPTYDFRILSMMP